MTANLSRSVTVHKSDSQFSLVTMGFQGDIKIIFKLLIFDGIDVPHEFVKKDWNIK